MKYTLNTKIRFATAVSTTVQESTSTMEELGFSQDELDSKNHKEIEDSLQEMFTDWEANHLDSGWAVVED